MADVKAIRDRLKTNLQTITNLFAFDTMPSTPVVPCAIVAPAPGMFLADVSMDGVETLDFVVTVLVSKDVDTVAQDNLDTYLSDTTADIVAALESSSTTDWDYCVAMARRNYGRYQFGDGDAAQFFLGFEIPLEIGVS